MNSQQPFETAHQIDHLCDQFEQAWKSGARPPIEDFLVQVAPTHRARLLEDLLGVELQLRQKEGETLSLERFRQRFVAHAKSVETVFRRVVRPRRLGDYELLEELDRGGMGVVYRARQVYLDQIVAVKVLPQEYLSNEQVVARFLREMKSIGSLDHPNIVRPFYAGQAEGMLFLAMEYLDGVNLHRLVEQRHSRNEKPLSVATVCELVRQAALGLQHAHERSVIHRDIKPSNLMLTSDGRVRVLDLGLAHFQFAASGELTTSGQVMGTVDYMSPEQAEQTRHADARSDIYSLGCTLYYLLAGQPVYVGVSLTQRILAHRERDIPSLRTARPDVPAELDGLFRSMVSKRPADRPASMAEVITALQKIPMGRPKVREETAMHWERSEAVAVSAEGTPTSAENTLRREVAIETERLGETAGQPVTAQTVPRVQVPESTWMRAVTMLKARRSRTIGAAVILMFMGAMLYGIVLRWNTPEGTLVVEINQPDAIVEVDGGKWSFAVPGAEPVEVQLAPGEHTLRVTKGGFETCTQDFQVRSGDRELLRVRLEPVKSGESSTSVSGTTPTDVPPPPASVVVPSPATGGLPPRAIAPFDAQQARAHQEAWAKHLGVPAETTNSLGMKLVLIPPGEFDMGASQVEIDQQLEWANRLKLDEWQIAGFRSEGPQHRVKITRPFCLGKHEVTVAQFRQFVDATGYKTEAESDGKGAEGLDLAKGQGIRDLRYTWLFPGFKQPDEHPVVCVSWSDTKAFCDWLGNSEHAVYRLPTEAEWEYACRAGTTTSFFTGDDVRALQGHAHITNLATAAANPLIMPSVAWNDGFPFTAPVGQFTPNSLGLHDMHGNVWEWCADWCGFDYYAHSPQENPTGQEAGGFNGKILRGGQGLGDVASRCRSACRGVGGVGVSTSDSAWSAITRHRQRSHNRLHQGDRVAVVLFLEQLQQESAGHALGITEALHAPAQTAASHPQAGRAAAYRPD